MSADAGSRLGPDAPWIAYEDEHGESRRGYRVEFTADATIPHRALWFDVSEVTRAEVFAIRDALNAVARGTVPGEPDDTVTKAVVYARTALEDACRLIETGDARLLASDGPAGDRPPELSLAEWRKLYVTLDKARKRLWAIASRIVAARGEASESRSVGASETIRNLIAKWRWRAERDRTEQIDRPADAVRGNCADELEAALNGVRAGEPDIEAIRKDKAVRAAFTEWECTNEKGPIEVWRTAERALIREILRASRLIPQPEARIWKPAPDDTGKS